eukprot:TRINITY_DN23_c0_g1_i3.p1 TRINITY_DN23_c0_g1~~TRINITY_DN23_c0_g1_i3.p1  ORF type:complete len:238 (-),score=28.85 TRINITY_DN23_c0_g1_i3:455-1093(-)
MDTDVGKKATEAAKKGERPPPQGERPRQGGDNGEQGERPPQRRQWGANIPQLTELDDDARSALEFLSQSPADDQARPCLLYDPRSLKLKVHSGIVKFAAKRKEEQHRRMAERIMAIEQELDNQCGGSCIYFRKGIPCRKKLHFSDRLFCSSHRRLAKTGPYALEYAEYLILEEDMKHQAFLNRMEGQDSAPSRGDDFTPYRLHQAPPPSRFH